MTLIPEARQWWRLWSVRLIAAFLFVDALTLAPVMAMLPDSIRSINPGVFDAAQFVLAVLALWARFIKQSKLEKKRGQ